MKYWCSVVIIAQNVDDIIGKCLQAATQISDDIIVIDHQSTDNTINICRQYTDKIYSIDWQGYSFSKNLGSTKTNYDWIVSLDSDEVVSDQLIDSITNLRPRIGELYSLRVNNNYLGQWMRYTEMRPDYKPRLFNKKYASWNSKSVHERLVFEIETSIIPLNGDLLHYSYRKPDDLKNKTERYARLAAQDLFDRNINHSYLKKQFAPIARFIKSYFFQRGILEGKAGWEISKASHDTVKLRYQYLKELKTIKS